MLKRSLRPAAHVTLPTDRVFSAVMATIAREARSSGLSVSALGVLVAERLNANLTEAAMSAMCRERFSSANREVALP
jgi:hypothetical protein